MIRNLIIPYRSVQLPTITSTSPLPTAISGQPYSFQFQATGGSYPYTWSSSGTGAFSLSASGLLTGTPVTTGTFNFTITAKDSFFPTGGNSVSASFQIAVVSPSIPSITTTSPLPNATVGSPYSFSMSAAGGVAPYTWAITADSPDTGGWLSISSGGVLSGTPGTVETESVTIVATDSALTPSAPVTFTLSVVAAGVYTADHFISPTGDDVTGDGSRGNPWSLGALSRADGIGLGQWHQLGVMPGVYNGARANGVLTLSGDFINANGSTPYNMTAGGAAGNSRVIFSCDANGNYSPRTAVWDNGTQNPYFTTNNPIRQGAFLGLGNQSHIIIDGIMMQNGSTNGISGGTGADVKILNCDIGNAQSPENGTNPSLVSFSPGADAIYYYNSSFHDAQMLLNIPITLTGITSTGATLTAINGVSTSGTGWPFDNTSANGTPASLTFTDTNQTLTLIVTGTHGSNSLTWPSTAITGTPSGAATISMGSLNVIHDIWGFYQEGCGLTTPTLIESCAFRATGQQGMKTTPGNVGAKRSWFEANKFGVPESGSAHYAFTQPGPQTGVAVGFDHCIFVGAFLGFGQGAVGETNSIRGTLNFTNNTVFSPPGASAGWIAAISQASPPTINSSHNIFAASSGGWVEWAASGGSNYGTVNSSNNVFLNAAVDGSGTALFNRTNTPANNPIAHNGGTSYTLATVKSSLGYETGSIGLGGATPFSATPANGYPESFTTNGSATIAGVICGAIDGTVGANGVVNGPNFLSFTGTNAIGTAKVGTAYSAQITALGGSGSYTYSLSASPNWLLWLSINSSTGALSGTPPMPGTEAIAITAVCNVTGRRGTALMNLTVAHQ